MSAPPITGTTRLAGVIGWPVAHSRSPLLHNAAYRALGLDLVYVPIPVPPGRLAAALGGLRAFGFVGANVTVPYKQDVAALCDALDPDAITAGAVNTLSLDAEGRLHGANTDVGGYADALDAAKVPRGGAAVVLGTGGAARSVVLALARRGHAVTVIARDPARGASLMPLGAADVRPWTGAALAEAFGSASVLCDATSIALDPGREAAVVDALPLGALPAGALVSSLIYHRWPALLARAQARGLATQDGAPMLVFQAARALRLMTGREPPLDVMRAAFAAENDKASRSEE